MLKKTLLSLSLLAAAGAHASDWDGLSSLAQPQFEALSKDLGSALSYKAVSPGEPLGLLGFDIGAEVTATKLKSADALEKATGKDVSYLPVPKLHAHKGLPLDIDVGAFISKLPGVDGRLLGAELRWAPIAGNVAMPAVAIRATYTRLDGVDELDFDSKGIEATISKGFTILKPYAGVGYVKSTSTPNGSAATVLKKVSNDQMKYFAGLNINLGLMNFALEADKTGDSPTYGAKLGLRF
jgi:hypothetical protein